MAREKTEHALQSCHISDMDRPRRSLTCRICNGHIFSSFCALYASSRVVSPATDLCVSTPSSSPASRRTMMALSRLSSFHQAVDGFAHKIPTIVRVGHSQARRLSDPAETTIVAIAEAQVRHEHRMELQELHL